MQVHAFSARFRALYNFVRYRTHLHLCENFICTSKRKTSAIMSVFFVRYFVLLAAVKQVRMCSKDITSTCETCMLNTYTISLIYIGNLSSTSYSLSIKAALKCRVYIMFGGMCARISVCISVFYFIYVPILMLRNFIHT